MEIMTPLCNAARTLSGDIDRRVSRLGTRSLPASWQEAQSSLYNPAPSSAETSRQAKKSSAMQPVAQLTNFFIGRCLGLILEWAQVYIRPRRLAEFFKCGIAIVFLGLTQRNTQGFPFTAAKRLRQVNDLSNVIAGVGQQPMQRFMNAKRYSTNRDRSREVGVAQ